MCTRRSARSCTARGGDATAPMSASSSGIEASPSVISSSASGSTRRLRPRGLAPCSRCGTGPTNEPARLPAGPRVEVTGGDLADPWRDRARARHYRAGAGAGAPRRASRAVVREGTRLTLSRGDQRLRPPPTLRARPRRAAREPPRRVDARGERRLAPVLRQSGPVREVVKRGAEVDLSELPIIDHFTEDAGPYITNGIVVAKDPDTGVRNASFHRMELRGRNRVGTSLHSRRHLWDYQRRAEERSEALAVAVVIGAHPLFHFGSGLWKGPIDADEYEVAGGFLGEPLEIVPGLTVPVESPCEAEFVLEGRILSGTREPEGPFAEFTGYASERSTQHVIEVSAITHRRDALYQDIVGGISAEHTQLLAVPQEARMLKVLRGHYPSVRAVSYPHSGTCRLHCYVSMKPSAEGQAKNAAMTAFGEDLA